MIVKLIVAMEKNNGIGYKNCLPWHIPSDLKHFKQLTIGNGHNAIIMGRKTYESIGRPLPNRYNIIVSKKMQSSSNVTVVNSIADALQLCKQQLIDEVWFIGGHNIYKEALESNYVKELYITKINENYKCDVFFPKLPNNFIINERKKIDNLVDHLVYKENSIKN